MATEAVEEKKMEIDEGETIEVDDYVASFEALDVDGTEDGSGNVEDYVTLLKNPRFDERAVKVKEQCIYKLARLYTEQKRMDDVMSLLKSNNEFFSIIPKAKTAKIVRSILSIVGTIPDSLNIQVGFARDIVAWCIQEKRTFLRQRIEAKLCSLLLQQKEPIVALGLIDSLLPELKKLDDKQMLTETHLTESRIYHSLQNIPKSKASLTASRSAANSIYVTPLLQAEIDEMSGSLHCEEGDYNTAYSYFLEAFDGYDQNNAPAAAVSCLKYMILCKVLDDKASESAALVSGKMGMKHAGVDLEAMAAIAKAAKAKSLDEFTAATSKYDTQLKHDDLIAHHLDVLYDTMMEANILKIIYPYSSVEITHIAKLINLPEQQIVHKLSQMILDHKFFGILEQGKGHLIIYDSAGEDKNFAKGVEIIQNMENVVETLFERAKSLAKSESVVAAAGTTTTAAAAVGSTASGNENTGDAAAEGPKTPDKDKKKK